MSTNLRHHPGSANPRAGAVPGSVMAPNRGPAEYTPQSTPGRGPAGIDAMLRAAKFAQAQVQAEHRKRLVRWHLVRAPKPKRPREL